MISMHDLLTIPKIIRVREKLDTYLLVEMLVTLLFLLVHLVHCMRFLHGKFTLVQGDHHSLIWPIPEGNKTIYRIQYKPKDNAVCHHILRANH